MQCLLTCKRNGLQGIIFTNSVVSQFCYSIRNLEFCLCLFAGIIVEFLLSLTIKNSVLCFKGSIACVNCELRASCQLRKCTGANCLDVLAQFHSCHIRPGNKGLCTNTRNAVNLEVLVKTDGYPRYALFTVITGCLTNCVLDYVAIFWLNMGVFGAAAATGISQLVTCVLYLIHFFSKKCTFHLRKFRFDPHLYARILPIGLADGVTELCTGLMIFLFNHTVLRCIGTDGVVTYTVIAYVNTVVINLMVGISQGSQPLVSFHYGKGEHDQCQKLLRYGLTTVCIIAPLLFLCVYFFAPQIVSAYLSHASDELVAYSVRAFRHYGISYLLVGFNVVIGGFLTALERPILAISISVGRGLVLQSAVLLTLAAVFGGEALWYTPIISEALCLAMSVIFLRLYQGETRV